MEFAVEEGFWFDVDEFFEEEAHGSRFPGPGVPDKIDSDGIGFPCHDFLEYGLVEFSWIGVPI